MQNIFRWIWMLQTSESTISHALNFDHREILHIERFPVKFLAFVKFFMGSDVIDNLRQDTLYVGKYIYLKFDSKRE